MGGDDRQVARPGAQLVGGPQDGRVYDQDPAGTMIFFPTRIQTVTPILTIPVSATSQVSYRKARYMRTESFIRSLRVYRFDGYSS